MASWLTLHTLAHRREPAITADVLPREQARLVLLREDLGDELAPAADPNFLEHGLQMLLHRAAADAVSGAATALVALDAELGGVAFGSARTNQSASAAAS